MSHSPRFFVPINQKMSSDDIVHRFLFFSFVLFPEQCPSVSAMSGHLCFYILKNDIPRIPEESRRAYRQELSWQLLHPTL